MLEFENLVYLDVQKTGSAFVINFFRRFVASPEIQFREKAPLAQRKNGAVHVISCRHPFHQYLSLYAYGCEGRGGFRRQMDAAGFGYLYDGSSSGFARWLELLLSSAGAQFAGVDDRSQSEIFGYQTFRFLRMALPRHAKNLRAVKTKADLKDRLSQSGMADVVLRQETLNDDLLDLISGQHAHLFRDKQAIPSYLSEAKRLNASADLHIDESALPSALLAKLREREWLLFDVLGYQ